MTTQPDYYFIYDTETTGLPKKTYERRYNPLTLTDFDSARLLSIAWYLVDGNGVKVESHYHVIKPDRFIVHPESIKFHGITQEHANKYGICIFEVLNELERVFTRYNIKKIVAHNIEFDSAILLSELYRYRYDDLYKILMNTEQLCTMMETYKKLQLSKYPKLCEAYKIFYNLDMDNAHNAEWDTYYCYKIFLKLLRLDSSFDVRTWRRDGYNSNVFI